MRKEVYVALIALVIAVTIFALSPSLKTKVVSTLSQPFPTVGLGPAADVYKTTVIVYKGEVQLSDFDKKGILKPVRMIYEGQSAVVKAKRKEEPEEASRILGVTRLVFPHIIETFYQRVEVLTAALPQGASNIVLSQQNISHGLNKNLSRTLVSDIEVELHPEGFRGHALLRAGVIQVPISGSGVISTDLQNGGRLILRLREIKAGKLALPDAFLRDMERAFSSVFSNLPVNVTSIQFQPEALQINCYKSS